MIIEKKALGILFLLTILFVVGSVFAVNTCIDSDGGKNYTVFGSTFGLSGGASYLNNDTCVGSTVLSEKFCWYNMSNSTDFNCSSLDSNYKYCNGTYACVRTSSYSCFSGYCKISGGGSGCAPCADGCLNGVCVAQTNCTDSDSDGYFSTVNCGTLVDCNDLNHNIHPGALEIQCNGIDENCDAINDCNQNQTNITCIDSDADGYFSTANCGTIIDCNDYNPSIYLGAVEIQCNGIDDDCNGADLCGNETGYCGDGISQPGEGCDGSDLGGHNCSNLPGPYDFIGGTLSCSPNCNYDTSDCILNTNFYCIDTDGGKNLNVKGFCNDSRGVQIGDGCVSGELREVFCLSGTNYSYCTFDDFTCPNGCSNGACIKKTVNSCGLFKRITGKCGGVSKGGVASSSFTPTGKVVDSAPREKCFFLKKWLKPSSCKTGLDR